MKLLRLDQIVPLPVKGLKDRFYRDWKYQQLKSSIQEGYNKAYPIRVRWNKKLGVYECIDGNNRIKVQKECGRETIWAMVESLTDAEAIHQAVQANNCREGMNVMDYAKSLYSLGEVLAKSKTAKTKPFELDVEGVARLEHLSKGKVSQYFKLLKFSEHVQTLIGRGKLYFSQARVLCKLLDTSYEEQIDDIADKVIKGMTTDNLTAWVNALLNKGFYEVDKGVCSFCHGIHPKERLSHRYSCSDCNSQIREFMLQRLDTKAQDKHKEAMRKFLKVNDFLEKKYGKDIPDYWKEELNKLHSEWKGDKTEQDYVV